MKYIYNISSYTKPGYIITVKKYSYFTKREITIFKAYIGDGINEAFLSSLPLWKENITSIEIHKGYNRNPKIVALSKENPMKSIKIPKLTGKVVFILVHGLDTTEFHNSSDIPFYTKYRRTFVHSMIRKYFPDSVILHYIYPSLTKRLIDNSTLFINTLQNTLPTLHESKHLFMIGYSLGGLVVKASLQMSKWLRNITTKAILINTPHRGTPLISLLIASEKFWHHLYKTYPYHSTISLLKEASYLAFHTGIILSPGHLDLIWENIEQLPGIRENTLLRTLNKYNTFQKYTFVGSIIPKYQTIQTLKLLIKHLQYEPTERFGLLLCDLLIRTFGKVTGIKTLNVSDGVASLNSQIPIKYQNSFIHTTPLIFVDDHLDIIINSNMWHQVLVNLS